MFAIFHLDFFIWSLFDLYSYMLNFLWNSTLSQSVIVPPRRDVIFRSNFYGTYHLGGTSFRIKKELWKSVNVYKVMAEQLNKYLYIKKFGKMKTSFFEDGLKFKV